MTQIPILSGMFTDTGPDLRTAYPFNMVPVPKDSGISAGYLRPADGITKLGDGPGANRGGINWNGECYRVMGTKLVKVGSDGTTLTLGDVGDGGRVSMDYGFGRLAIASGGRLYYWDGLALTQVTDPDLGNALDVIWVDGYFMTHDGTNLVITELSDPLEISPLKYGSSEVDPDPLVAVKKIRNEPYAVNRHTIEVFDNVGGTGFPFQRIPGAQITRGAVGTHACCSFVDALAFVGSARNEPVGVYLGANATSNKVSTREIETILAGYTEAELSQTVLEARNDRESQFLYVHLPNETLVFDLDATKAAGTPVWHILGSGQVKGNRYLARDFVWIRDRWEVGDPTGTELGYIDGTIGSHWGQHVGWEFSTMVLYNNSRGALFNELELVAPARNIAFGDAPRISTSYSNDGQTWSQEKWISVGSQGQRTKRLVWFTQGYVRNWRVQRFRGDSRARISVARLEAQIEPMGA